MDEAKKPIMALPCKMQHEKMELTENGYQCNSCEKVLIDFRGKDTAEINALIRENKGRTCGIFNPDQYTFKESVVQFRPFQRLGLSLLGILGFIGPVVVTTSCESEPTSEEKKQQAFNNLKFPMHLKGIVRDEDTNEPLSESKLALFQNGKEIKHFVTDKNGHFDVLIEKGDLHQEDFTLILGHDYFTNDTVPMSAVSYAQSKQKIALTLKAEPKSCVESTLGEMAETKSSSSVEGELVLSGDIVESVSIPEPPLAGVPMEE